MPVCCSSGPPSCPCPLSLGPAFDALSLRTHFSTCSGQTPEDSGPGKISKPLTKNQESKSSGTTCNAAQRNAHSFKWSSSGASFAASKSEKIDRVGSWVSNEFQGKQITRRLAQLYSTELLKTQLLGGGTTVGMIG